MAVVREAVEALREPEPEPEPEHEVVHVTLLTMNGRIADEFDYVIPVISVAGVMTQSLPLNFLLLEADRRRAERRRAEHQGRAIEDELDPAEYHSHPGRPNARKWLCFFPQTTEPLGAMARLERHVIREAGRSSLTLQLIRRRIAGE